MATLFNVLEYTSCDQIVCEKMKGTGDGMLALSEVFKGEYLQYVSNYVKRIQRVLDEYDVAVFMARKAICFYEALSQNGLIRNEKCQVISSRATDYNIIGEYKDKRIVLVDDVVVKGNSLKLVISRFKGYSIRPDILVIACEKEFQNGLNQRQGYSVIDSYVTLEQKDIYSFAGMITEYIEASMCSLNTDCPVYEIDISKDSLDELQYLNHAVTISSSLQQKQMISSKVAFFNCHEALLQRYPRMSFLADSVIKIRFLRNSQRTIAIPFVLLPEISVEKLRGIVGDNMDAEVDAFLCSKQSSIFYENQLKLLNYSLGEILAQQFLGVRGITYRKIERFDFYQFSRNTSFFASSLNSLINEATLVFSDVIPVSFTFSTFDFTNQLALCYTKIAQYEKKPLCYFNANREPISSDIIITHKSLADFINEKNKEVDAFYTASCIIDVLIDKGMIVPSVVHTATTIIRAYKMGEYSKLTRTEIDAFLSMLYAYQSLKNDNIGKTEFEKLCVLFFKKMIRFGFFNQQENFEDGCYSVCYSLYGPRVSSSALSYKVDSDETLISEFCSFYSSDSYSVRREKDKYVINSRYASKEYAPICMAFAIQYNSLRELFEAERTAMDNTDGKNTPWNMYVHTFVQYITLFSIGENMKSQFLSLCAELFQVVSLSSEFFSFGASDTKGAERVFSGINSGLWKYWCYSNNALEKTTKQIADRNILLASHFFNDKDTPSERRKEWTELIDETGKLLYEIAFFFAAAIDAFRKTTLFSVKDEFGEGSDYKVSGLFSKGCFYNKAFRDLRKRIKDDIDSHLKKGDLEGWCSEELYYYQLKASSVLDRCDLILAGNSVNPQCVDKFLILYSAIGEFNEDSFEGRRKLRVDGIRSREKVRIISIAQQDDPLSVAEYFARFGVVAIYVDFSNYRSALGIYTNDMDNGKGTRVVSVINNIVNEVAHREEHALSHIERLYACGTNATFQYLQEKGVKVIEKSSLKVCLLNNFGKRLSDELGFVAVHKVGINQQLIDWACKSDLYKKALGEHFEKTNDLLDQALGPNETYRYMATYELMKNIWETHPELGINPEYKLLSESEYGGEFYSSYRDHMTHMFKVFILGGFLFDKHPRIKVAFEKKGYDVDSFISAWILTALYHDIGYLIEKGDGEGESAQIVYKQFNNSLSLPLTRLFPKVFQAAGETAQQKKQNLYPAKIDAITSLESKLVEFNGYGCKVRLSQDPDANPIETYFNKQKTIGRERSYYDHGIIGACIMLFAWDSVCTYLKAINVDKFYNGKQEIEMFRASMAQATLCVKDAARAVALHNIKKDLNEVAIQNLYARNVTISDFCIPLDEEPLAYLLRLCDEIQCWDRQRFVSPIKKDDGRHMLAEIKDEQPSGDMLELLEYGGRFSLSIQAKAAKKRIEEGLAGIIDPPLSEIMPLD